MRQAFLEMRDRWLAGTVGYFIITLLMYTVYFALGLASHPNTLLINRIDVAGKLLFLIWFISFVVMLIFEITFWVFGGE